MTIDLRLSEWLGTGWNHPVAPDVARGALSYSDGAEKVRQSIRLILQTEPGERVMRPSFGCGLTQFLMLPNSVATRALIQAEVSRAIDVWEPRVEVRAVTVDTGDDPSLVIITIGYEHKTTGRTDAVVLPFALQVTR